MRIRMNVCLKPIAENPCGGWRSIKDFEIRNESDRFRMNLYDAHALEAALQLKSRLSEAFVQAIGLGPFGTETVLKRAVGMGADRAVQGTVPEPLDALSIAGALAELVRRYPCDLLFFGYMAEDSQQALTGPMTAALLDWPCLSAVVSERVLQGEDGRLRVCATRELEAGVLETVECPLPAVLTIQTRAVQPRYPVLSKMLRSKDALLQIDARNMPPLSESVLKTVDIQLPQASRSTIRLEGTPEEQALALVDWLRIHHQLFMEVSG
ncbi:MAG: electron transfer flavoprotein subunit beta/FixA family protein [Thermodesulfobacteriota bacterium]